MFLGHYGLALALKRKEPKVSLGTLFIAVQLVDILWGGFLLLGWEHVRILPDDNPLLTLPNVVTAPHMAGVTKESFDRMAVAVSNNLLDVMDGKPNMDHVVNKEVFAHR